jgi:hypothetical protein
MTAAPAEKVIPERQASATTKPTKATETVVSLGDTVRTVEKHYAPFVKELRDRARRFMENGKGLEQTSDTIWAQSSGAPRRLQ